MNFNPILIPIVLSILGLVYMYFKAKWVKKQDPGNEKMVSISSAIKKGALAFLNAEYRLLLIFVVFASAALFGISLVVETTSWLIIPAFIVGAIFSGLAGNIGMRIATDANSRTTQAARTSLPKALDVAFGGGTVMGLGVAGLAVLVLSLFFMFFINQFPASQTLGILAAMTSNYFLNNTITFQERKLKSFDLVRGLFSFYLICSLGAFTNIAIASYVFGFSSNWLISSFIGALFGAIWNFTLTSIFTWKSK